jgi:malonyl-CoA O-methyltransferase
MNPQDVFDHRQVRRAFSRAAGSYSAAAELQREIESRLFESLDYLGDQVPTSILDLGSGPGTGALELRRRWPKARVVAMDLALPMLRQVAPKRGWNPLQRPIDRVCADARALPVADDSVDLIFSNLCLQWVEDLDALFAGFRRVLRPGGLLLVSTFGPDTLHELRASFAAADAADHVSPFPAIAEFGDALMRAGFRDPVLDRDVELHRHPAMADLMRGLRELGATNALASRRRALTGRGRFAAAQAAYESWRGEDGQLPATWEIITAMAWAPAHGQPIREGGEDVARFPASGIPVRRRGG